MRELEHLVVARVQDLLLGFDVHDVREVLNDEQVLPVPLTAPVVKGLINLRGEVVTVIDGRVLLKMTDLPSDLRTSTLVVQHRRDLLSLVVDEVLEVVNVDPAQISQRPDGMADAVRRLARSVLHREKDLVVIVDVVQFFEIVANGSKCE